jgi:polysaccharide deacetylase family protein (PEP-CTERM system associated)
MNVLTFYIEDWYNCDFISPDLDWEKYEVRIYEGVERILLALNERDLKATFFCLGWVAQNHPKVIGRIHEQGHHIGCHSFKHDLAYTFNRKGFKSDTEKAKKTIEDLIGVSVTAYRAPGFSIKKENVWAFEVLNELGFEYDSSVFPAAHDYGGFPEIGISEPFLLQLPNGCFLKEFPMSTKSVLGRQLVFSGGGFFRIFPYWLILYWAKHSDYLMTYFHPRDFDPGQPLMETLPLMRKFKSYVGLKQAFPKFQRFISEFQFHSLMEADKIIDWYKVRTVKIDQ